MKNLILIFTLLSASFSFGQEDGFIDQSFLIIISTKNYQSALKKAQLACNDLGIPLNLNGNFASKEYGLDNNTVCGCGEQHGYIPRGRGENGNYISIEYSSSYENFTPGYYIVVVSSGDKKDVKEFLPKAKKHFKDAYMKTSRVYMGCMH